MITILLSLLAGIVTWKFFPLTMSGYQRWRTSPIDFIITRVLATIFVTWVVAGSVSSDMKTESAHNPIKQSESNHR